MYSTIFACEQPQILEVTSSLNHNKQIIDLRFTWAEVTQATSYEVDLHIKIPEGKILLQRQLEVKETNASTSIENFSNGKPLQLLTTVRAKCLQQVSAASKKISIYAFSERTCQLDPNKIIHTKNTLGTQIKWLPVRQADYYLICQNQKDMAPLPCQQSNQNYFSSQGRAGIVAITPYCYGSAGQTEYIHVSGAVAQ